MSERVPPEFEPFLAERRNAILCIARGPGEAPHATPVWFDYADGVFRISITRTRVKHRLLEAAPEVTLVIDDDARFQTVIASGPATLSDGDEELLDLSTRLREKYHPDAPRGSDEERLRSLRQEQRVVVTVRPAQVITWADG